MLRAAPGLNEAGRESDLEREHERDGETDYPGAQQERKSHHSWPRLLCQEGGPRGERETASAAVRARLE